MASTSASPFLLHSFTAFFIVSLPFPVIFKATVIEDLNNFQPPPDFNSTITNNCLKNPSLRYCNSNSNTLNLLEIFKFTIVASHLCNISNNPNCIESFPKIDLHGQPKMAPLYLSFTFFWKYCPLTILSIDISNSSLKGNFPTDIFYCSQIQALDLSHNNISGDFPVQDVSSLPNLTFLNLSYNDFSECRISETNFLSIFIRRALFILVFFLITESLGLKLRYFLWDFGFRDSSGGFLGMVLFSEAGFPQVYAFGCGGCKDGFSRRNFVGKTCGGSVYRGFLRDGSEVRIEVHLEKLPRETRRRFVEESNVLVRLKHRNIIPVLGWWNSRRFKATVTEWVDGDQNVEAWLKACVPPWKQRVKAIAGIAAGICYLHEEWPEVGYNLKTRNVLLSEDGKPLITRLKLDDHHSITKKIYRFGMFVLEMVTNRQPDEEFETNETDFLEWVKLHYPDDLENVIDRRMKRTADIVSEAEEITEFGLMCADLSSRRQPSWDAICDISSNISSTTSDHRISRADRGEGSKRVHHRGHSHVRFA